MSSDFAHSFASGFASPVASSNRAAAGQIAELKVSEFSQQLQPPKYQPLTKQYPFTRPANPSVNTPWRRLLRPDPHKHARESSAASLIASLSGRASADSDADPHWVHYPDDGPTQRGWAGFGAKLHTFSFTLPRDREDAVLQFWLACHGAGKRDSYGQIKLQSKGGALGGDVGFRTIASWSPQTISATVPPNFNTFLDPSPSGGVRPSAVRLGRLPKGETNVRFDYTNGLMGIVIFKVVLRADTPEAESDVKHEFETSSFGLSSRLDVSGFDGRVRAQLPTSNQAKRDDSDSDDDEEEDGKDSSGGGRKHKRGKDESTDSSSSSSSSSAAAPAAKRGKSEHSGSSGNSGGSSNSGNSGNSGGGGAGSSRTISGSSRSFSASESLLAPMTDDGELPSVKRESIEPPLASHQPQSPSQSQLADMELDSDSPPSSAPSSRSASPAVAAVSSPTGGDDGFVGSFALAAETAEDDDDGDSPMLVYADSPAKPAAPSVDKQEEATRSFNRFMAKLRSRMPQKAKPKQQAKGKQKQQEASSNSDDDSSSSTSSGSSSGEESSSESEAEDSEEDHVELDSLRKTRVLKCRSVDCNEEFPSAAKRVEHESEVHNMEQHSGGPEKCLKCHKQYSAKEMPRHIAQCDPKFSCRECVKKFQSRKLQIGHWSNTGHSIDDKHPHRPPRNAGTVRKRGKQSKATTTAAGAGSASGAKSSEGKQRFARKASSGRDDRNDRDEAAADDGGSRGGASQQRTRKATIAKRRETDSGSDSGDSDGEELQSAAAASALAN